jgi:hypothetical protein
MAKLKKTKKDKVAPPAPISWTISPQAKKLLIVGALTVIIGFSVLTKADSLGRNWASSASPLLILSGYLLIGIALFLPGEDSSPTSPLQ